MHVFVYVSLHVFDLDSVWRVRAYTVHTHTHVCITCLNTPSQFVFEIYVPIASEWLLAVFEQVSRPIVLFALGGFIFCVAGMARLGLDFGGVLSVYDIDAVLQTHAFVATPDLICSVKALVSYFGRSNVFIVSRAGYRMAHAAQDWLHASGFFRETGVDPDHFHAVQYRSQKRAACIRLGISHFVDDRWDVLRGLNCERRYLFSADCSAPNGANGLPRPLPSNLVIAAGWRDVLGDLGLAVPRPSAAPIFHFEPPPRPSSRPALDVDDESDVIRPTARRRIGDDDDIVNVYVSLASSAAPSSSASPSIAAPSSSALPSSAAPSSSASPSSAAPSPSSAAPRPAGFASERMRINKYFQHIM